MNEETLSADDLARLLNKGPRMNSWGWCFSKEIGWLTSQQRNLRSLSMMLFLFFSLYSFGCWKIHAQHSAVV